MTHTMWGPKFKRFLKYKQRWAKALSTYTGVYLKRGVPPPPPFCFLLCCLKVLLCKNTRIHFQEHAIPTSVHKTIKSKAMLTKQMPGKKLFLNYKLTSKTQIYLPKRLY